MAENKVLIEVEIDSGKAQTRTVQLTKLLAKQRQELKEQRKALNDSKGANTKAAIEVARLSQSIKENNAELRRAQKEANAEESSINALRASVNNLNAERNSLNTSTAEGAKRFAELTVQLKEQREKLNELSQSAGSFRENVGNYTASIQQALGLNVDFIGSLDGLKDGFGGLAGSTKGFAVALASIPLIAVITAITTFLQRTREGRQLLERFGAVAQATFGVLLDGLASAGKAFIDLISSGENIEQLFVDIGEAIKTNIQNRIDGAIEAFGAFSDVIRNVIAGDFDKAKDSAVDFGKAVGQGLTGITGEQLQSAVDGVKSLGETIADTASNADRLAQANINLRASIRANIEASREAQRNAEISRKQRDDEFKSLSERLALNEEVLKQEKLRTEAQLAENRARQQIIKNEIALAGGFKNATEEQLDALAQLRGEALEIEEDFAGRTTEVLTEANSIRREELQAQLTFDKAVLEERIIAEELAGEELLKQQRAILAQEREIALVGLAEGSIEREAVIQEFKVRELELIRDFNATRAEEEQEAEEARLEAIQEANERELEQARRKLEQQKAIAQASQEVENARVANLQAGADAVIRIFGEESFAGKAAFILKQGIAVAEVGLNLAKQISAIQLAAAQIAAAFPPPFGLAQAGIYASAATTQANIAAAINVATITAQTVEGFAKGGSVMTNIRGEGLRAVPNRRLSGYTGNGDPSQPAGFLSGGNVGHYGEFVVSAPIVAKNGGPEALARKTGQPVNGFASGGVNMLGSAARSRSLESTMFAEAMSSLNIELSLTELSRKQKRFNQNNVKVNA